jgi:hypothetical protein
VWEDNDVTFLDLTPLRLTAGYFVPFIVPRRATEPTEDLTASLVLQLGWKYLREQNVRMCVVAVDSELCPSEQDLEFARRYGVAILDESLRRGIGAGRDRELVNRAIASALVRYLGRESLSPYVPGRPVSGGQFFGRQQLLNQLTSGARANYTILGTRRIGKTSLLQQVRASLELSYHNLQAVWLNAQVCATSDDLEQQLAVRLDSKNLKTVYAGLARRWLHRYLLQKQTLAHDTVIFIDELDYLVTVDSRSGFRFLSFLRMLAEDRSCQVLLAGSYLSMRACRDMQTPLFNFTQPLFLGPLSDVETLDMVSQPLGMLGIDLSGSDIPAAIYDETRGYPELVQICCAEVVRRTHDQHHAPSAGEILGSLLPSRLFRERVVQVFLENTREIERIVFFVLLDAARKKEIAFDRFTFGSDDIQSLLSLRDIRIARAELDDVLLNLEVTSAIQRLPGAWDRFRFGLPSLANRHSSDLPLYLSEAMSRALTDPPLGSEAAVGASEANRDFQGLTDETKSPTGLEVVEKFFVSYAKVDEPWANWISWILEEFGYSVVVQCWDFMPGVNFVSAMQDAVTAAERTIIVLSPEYLTSVYCRAEWTASFARDPLGASRKLVPVRVRPCKPEGLLKTLVYLDLVGMSREEARASLLGAFESRRKPDLEPDFPTREAVEFPAFKSSVTRSASGGGSSNNEKGDSPSISIGDAMRRVELLQFLTDMPLEVFNMLAFALRPPPGRVQCVPVKQSLRAAQLLEWAEESGGASIEVLCSVLNELTTEFL